MTELQELMRQNVVDPPHDDLDLRDVVAVGGRRARARRRRIVGLAASATAGVAVMAAVVVPHGSHGLGRQGGPPANDPPAPRGTLHLSDAKPAVAGRDYQVLASITNPNLDRDNGQSFDGVTDDGMILLQDGPYLDRTYARYALMDPATGVKHWLPNLGIGQDQTVPVELGAHRLVLLSEGGVVPTGPLVGHVFDRDTWQWRTIRWPSLPDVQGPGGVMGPDGRLYVAVLATQGTIPEKWPLGRGKEADDSGASGDTYHLWSVSLDDSSDVRDEGRSVGSVTFTPTSMVWTDRTNGAGGLVHVRNLATGQEHSFDPHSGPNCNLLGLSATDDRVVLDEYCGENSNAVRDDRMQILTTDGDPVATFQGNGIGGGIVGLGGDDQVVTIYSLAPGTSGTYVYDLATGSFLHIADGMSKWNSGGPAPDGDFMWQTPVDHGHGNTERLGQLTR